MKLMIKLHFSMIAVKYDVLIFRENVSNIYNEFIWV